MDLANDGSHWVLQGQLDGTTADDQLIVLDGAKFMQEGDTLPAVAPFQFTSFGTGALRVSTAGDVVWVGDWNDPDTTKDVGLFLNEQLVVQEGVTTIGGLVVESISTVQENFAISANGRYIVFEATLQGGLNGVFRIDRGPWLDLGAAKIGTNGKPRLLGSGSLVTGTPLSLSLQNAMPNAPVTFIVGLTVLGVPFLGGTLVPAPNLVIGGIPTDPAGNLLLTTTWPTAPPGFVFIVQTFFPDPGAFSGVGASNAVLGVAP